jgi:hypothetical protein
MPREWDVIFPFFIHLFAHIHYEESEEATHYPQSGIARLASPRSNLPAFSKIERSVKVVVVVLVEEALAETTEAFI